MILKLILLGAVLLAVYRFAGGSFQITNNKKNIDKSSDLDALSECETCGTYVTARESIVLKGHIYCSKECLPN